jgi:hypothetical protein
MRHLAPKLSVERLMPFSLPSIVGVGRSRSSVPAHVARARKESASPKRQRCLRSSPPSLFNSALELAVASKASSFWEARSPWRPQLNVSR